MLFRWFYEDFSFKWSQSQYDWNQKKDVYGAETLDDINAQLKAYGESKNAEMSFYQSNHEGDIIDLIHKSKDEYDGVIINAGAYTHYSYAIRDAIEAVSDYTPFVEVHMSDIHKREDFRKFLSSHLFVLNKFAASAKIVIKWVLIYCLKYCKIN